jgi:hypothetical protein
VPFGPDLVDEPRRAIEGRDCRRPRGVQGASAPRLHTRPESASKLARKGGALLVIAHRGPGEVDGSSMAGHWSMPCAPYGYDVTMA